MKKIVILFIAIIFSFSSFAQRTKSVSAQTVLFFNGSNAVFLNPGSYRTTTGIGDTVVLSHLLLGDTLTIYKSGVRDSGFVTGTNIWGDKAFAERYDCSDNMGNNMQVIGVFAMFSGKVSPSSAKTITFNVWSEGAQQMISATRYFRGFPYNVLDTLTVPITTLGIGPIVDTLKKFMFASPTSTYYSSFFIGYSMNYAFSALNGDTIGLSSTYNGDRHPLIDYELVYNTSAIDTTLDTVFNVQNATMESDNRWYDNYSEVDSIRNNLVIYPIVIIGHPAGVKGITRNNLTYYGNYPNPVTNSTNIKFALATGADITIEVMDMNGRTLNTIKQTNLTAGEHIIPVSTAGLASGDYLYLVRTSSGDGIAGKFTK